MTNPLQDIGQDFEVTLQFHAWGRGEQYFGDGMALWYTEAPSLTGKVFGARDYWKGLGILFDTYDNGNRQTQNHPFITVMYNDGTHSFVHGDSGLQVGVPACHSAFRSVFKPAPSRMNPPANQRSEVRVRYTNGRVTIDINVHTSDTWTRCVDVDGVVLPDSGYYFGLTASTGALAVIMFLFLFLFFFFLFSVSSSSSFFFSFLMYLFFFFSPFALSSSHMSTGDLSDNHDIHSFSLSTSKAPVVPTVETKSEMIAEKFENEKMMEDNMLDVKTGVDATTQVCFSSLFFP